MSPGVEFAVVLVGGCVTTFFALAILEMVREGRARRAQDSLETTDDAQRLETGSPPTMRQMTPEAMPIERPVRGERTARE
jgi:hypothetical protein